MVDGRSREPMLVIFMVLLFGGLGIAALLVATAVYTIMGTPP